MSRHEANIPVEAILQDCAAWTDEIVQAVSGAALKETRARAGAAFRNLSGNLRKSIRRKKSKLDKDTQLVGAFAPHAHLIEFGHDVKVSKDGAVVGHAPARPFLGPAADAVADRLPEIINGAVGPLSVRVER
jgi:phage gpG-like protein